MKKIKSKEKINVTYDTLSIKQIELQLKSEKYKEKYLKLLKSTVYGLIIVAAVASILATLIMPVLEVNTSSMKPTFNENDIVLALKTKNIKTGDVIAFYHGNKILVKRVIASSGNYVDIDEEGNVYINGYIINEPYVKEKILGETDVEFPYQVPEGAYFVLSDDRSSSIDSRNSEIGCALEENVIGKILIKVWPLK